MLILTSPLLLWGMAAVALPVVAHLLNRRVRRRVVFPTIRLLCEAAASRSRLFRLRRWVLLLLRCAAIVLLAWAFARPVWVGAGSAAGAGDGESLVLVLDVSASSGQRVEGVSVASRMAAAADRMIGELEPGRDRANLIYAGAKPWAAYPRPIANLDALRGELRELRPTEQRADLGGAIALAAAMLDDAGPRRIVVLSDMQETNWAEASAAVAGGDPAVRVEVAPIGAGDAANTAVLRPSVQSLRPIVRQPAVISAEVANFADQPREVRVSATVAGRSLGTRTLSLQARERRGVWFDAAFDQPRMHRAVLEVTGDNLEVDDRAYLAVETVERITIAVIGDDDPSQPTGSGYFIDRALAPGGESGDGFAVRHLRSSGVTADALRDAEAVIVGEVGTLGGSAIDALIQYVRSGGGVLMFLGDGPVAANLAALQRRAGAQPLIPFQPLQRMEARGRGGDGGWYFGEGAWDSPPLRSFDEASRLALGQVAITRTYAAGEIARDAFTLLRFTDGTPALVSLGYGRGKLTLANFTPAPDGGGLAKHGAFVALLHGMVEDLRPRGGAPQITVGDPIALTLPASSAATPGGVSIDAPDGKSIAARVSHDDAGVATVQAPRAERTGFYLVKQGDATLALIAANVDERESDLRRTHISSTNQAVSTREGQPVELRPGETRGRPLWPWFVMAAAAVIGLELALLTAWRR